MPLVVEDGSGKSDADAYIDIAFVSEFNTDYVGNTTWGTLALEEQERLIRRATALADATYGAKWEGTRKTATQSLDWPRSSVYVDGGILDEDSLPADLQRGVAQLVLDMQSSGALAAAGYTTGGSNIVREKKQVGPLLKEIEYQGQKSSQTWYYTAHSWFLCLLLEGTSGGRVYRV